MTALIDDVAQTMILPRFRRLSSEDIVSKSTPADPDDVVTVVDRQVEERLTHALMAMTPGAAVIGEEAVYADPRLLERLASDGPVWLVDPIDGTKNFANGDDRFGVMLAWVVGGRAEAAWIVLPGRGQTFVAEAGSGAFCNGVPVRVPPAAPEGPARGALFVRYMPEPLGRAVTEATRGRYRAESLSGCAAVEYTKILRGEEEFAIYYRLLPWDHAAPALILTEGGGRVAHLDGAAYTARSSHQVTIVARDESMSHEVRGWLAPHAGMDS